MGFIIRSEARLEELQTCQVRKYLSPNDLMSLVYATMYIVTGASLVWKVGRLYQRPAGIVLWIHEMCV